MCCSGVLRCCLFWFYPFSGNCSFEPLTAGSWTTQAVLWFDKIFRTFVKYILMNMGKTLTHLILYVLIGFSYEHTNTHTHTLHCGASSIVKCIFFLNFFWTSVEIKDAEMMTNYCAEQDFFFREMSNSFQNDNKWHNSGAFGCVNISHAMNRK